MFTATDAVPNCDRVKRRVTDNSKPPESFVDETVEVLFGEPHADSHDLHDYGTENQELVDVFRKDCSEIRWSVRPLIQTFQGMIRIGLIPITIDGFVPISLVSCHIFSQFLITSQCVWIDGILSLFFQLGGRRILGLSQGRAPSASARFRGL